MNHSNHVHSICTHATKDYEVKSILKLLNIEKKQTKTKNKQIYFYDSKIFLSLNLLMFHYATILTYLSSIFIVAYKGVGHVKMYGANSKVIVTTSLTITILLSYLKFSTR